MLSSHSSTNGFETDLGARVRTLRRERGLTLKGLGRLAGLSHPFLSQVERGLARPSVELGRADRRRAGRLGRPPLVAAARGRRRRSSSAATSANADERGLRELPGDAGRARSCASGPRAAAAGRDEYDVERRRDRDLRRPRRARGRPQRRRSTSSARATRCASTARPRIACAAPAGRNTRAPDRRRGVSARTALRPRLRALRGTPGPPAGRRPRAASPPRAASAAIATPSGPGP